MAQKKPASSGRESNASGWLLWLLALPLAAASVVALGALLTDKLALPLLAVVVVGVIVVLVAPLLIDRAITRAYRSIDPTAKGIAAQVTLVWNLAIVVALPLAAPSALGAALQRSGDWLFPTAHGTAPDGLREGMRAAGAKLSGVAIDAGVSDRVAPGADAGVARDAAADGADASAADDAPIPTDRDLSPQEILRLRADAVVIVAARGRADTSSIVARFTGISAPMVSGSGFIVDADGLVVTNEHVIHGAESIRVTLHDGRELTPVTLLAVDRSHDLALLRVDTRGLAAAPVSQDDTVAVGTRATAIGSPLGLSYTLTDGLISAVREAEGTTFLQIEAAIAPGSSGGPLFDPRGRVIGVTTATAGAAGMNLALHPRYIRGLLARTRTPRALAAFAPEVRVVDLELEGAEASPVERMNLNEAARMLAAGIESCRTRAPRGTFVTMRYDSRGRTRTRDGFVMPLATTEGGIESDLGGDGEACLADNLRLTGMRFLSILERDHRDEITAGNTLAVRFVARAGRDDRDAAVRGITVRYEIARRGARDAGDDEAPDDASDEP